MFSGQRYSKYQGDKLDDRLDGLIRGKKLDVQNDILMAPPMFHSPSSRLRFLDATVGFTIWLDIVELVENAQG